MRSVKLRGRGTPLSSVNVAVNVLVVAMAGVPERMPEESRTNPNGNVPEVTDHVPDPHAIRSWL